MSDCGTLAVVDAGLMAYGEALILQRRLVAARKSGSVPDTLLLVEHPPVVTLGRRAQESHLVLSREALAARGIEVFEIERGGDVTYHGPGQVVGYPVVDLRARNMTLSAYLRALEGALIETAAAFGIEAFRREGLTGVWTAKGKLAAIGIAASRWVTFHGFALNVGVDLASFDVIVPCGLAGERVTSMETVLASPVDIFAVKTAAASAVARALGLRASHGTMEDILSRSPSDGR